MVRSQPEKRRTGLTKSARTRQARQAQERVYAASDSGTKAADSESHTSVPGDERFLGRSAQVRYVLLAIALAMLLWFIVALREHEVWGLEVPMPTWALDIAALSPLLVLIRFWNPELRKESDTREFDLRVISGLYFLMAILGAALGGYWQLWPGVAISIAVHAGVSYTNRRAHSHD
jgi:hypothetical protein